MGNSYKRPLIGMKELKHLDKVIKPMPKSNLQYISLKTNLSRYINSPKECFEVFKKDLGLDLQTHNHHITDMILSYDENLLATTDKKSIKIWSLREHTLKSEFFPKSESYCGNLIFSPDNAHLLASNSDKFIEILNIKTNSLDHSIECPSLIYCMATSKSFEFLVISCEDYSICIFNCSNMTIKCVLKDHYCPISKIAVSNSGNYAVTGGHRDFYKKEVCDYVIRVWDIKKECIATWLIGNCSNINFISFSDDDSLLLTGYSKYAILWNFEKLSNQYETKTMPSFYLDSRKRKYSDKKTLVEKIIKKHCKFGNKVHNSWGFSRFYKRIRKFYKEPYEIELYEYNFQISCAKFTPCKNYFITSGIDTFKQNIYTKSDIKRLNIPYYIYDHNFFIIQNGKFALFFYRPSKLIAYNLFEEFASYYNLPCIYGNISSVAINTSGEMIAFGGSNNYLNSDSVQIDIWKLKTRLHKARLDNHFSQINALEFSEDSKYLVSASKDGRINFWDLKTRSTLLSFNTEKNIEKISLVDGLIFSKSTLNHIDLWDVKSQCHALSFQLLLPAKIMIIKYKENLFCNENLESNFKVWKLNDSHKNDFHKNVALLKMKYVVIKVKEDIIMVYNIKTIDKNLILG
ncbi:hypothetical protein SteCoe_28547 [Stentor coeruleus]|uniref:Anaphase-promoting complex subunit 4 WD40 domain-containing protein n=1 Tax=Stentor coeruleus TaxID=5963 RepID=A0A1R2B898_9CILI|nr:hypothetical protein SteCoe_28547 [Stentor coeruleus]